jgi:cell division septum initiation protein DivIVA
MIRSSILTAAAISAMLAAGCETAADDQAKVNAAQAEAEAKMEATQAEAEAKMKSAQADADEKIAEAQASFMRMREEYRHSMTESLADLDKSVTDIEAKANVATGQAKTDLEASLRSIRAARARFEADYAALETATAANWDAIKAHLDEEWSELTGLVDHS